MIQLPNLTNPFDHENNFYLSCQPSRIAKVLAHYELFKMVKDVPGDIVECGIFKGCSFARFSMMRELFPAVPPKKMVGFDIFGVFPETQFKEDQPLRKEFMEVAGAESISKAQLMTVLSNKNAEHNVELVEGDITLTVPKYVSQYPRMAISLLNLDVDIYEPSAVILEYLYPLIAPGGILILDDYSTFPGETKAVDDYFKGRDVQIRTFPFAKAPAYIIKK